MGHLILYICIYYVKFPGTIDNVGRCYVISKIFDDVRHLDARSQASRPL